MFDLFFLSESNKQMAILSIGISFIFLFPLCCKKTKKDKMQIRYNALLYSFSVMVAYMCALKSMWYLRGLVLEPDALKIVCTGIFLQSLFFLIRKNTLLKKTS